MVALNALPFYAEGSAYTHRLISGKLADQFGKIETLFYKVAEVEILVRNDD